MNSWMQYLLEANVYLAVSYGLYWLLLRRQTFYTSNRAYLLFSVVVCFTLPLVQLVLEPLPAPVAAVSNLAVTEGLPNIATLDRQPLPVSKPIKAITALYCTITTLMFVWFVTKLYSLLKLILRHTRTQHEGYTLVHMPHSSTPFSFFGYLFAVDDGQLPRAVLQHELVHIRHKHSLDIVLTELLKIICWFNPVVYLLQDSLKALHEYKADETAASTEQDQYVDLLIVQAYQSNGIALVNKFSNKQLLKTRIMKLYQKRSGKLARLNYLVALPLCAGLLISSSIAFSKDYGIFTVNIFDRKNTNTKNSVVNTYVSKPEVKNNTLQESNDDLLLVQHKGYTAWVKKLEVLEKLNKKEVFTANTLTDTDKDRLYTTYRIRVKILTNVSPKDRWRVTKVYPIATPGYKGPFRFPPPIIRPDNAMHQAKGTNVFKVASNSAPARSSSTKISKNSDDQVIKTTTISAIKDKASMQMSLNKYLIINLIPPVSKEGPAC